MSQQETAEGKKLREQILLLLGDPKLLSDEQIAALLANSEALNKALYHLRHSFPFPVEQVRRYRAKKKELSVLPTQQLRAMQERIIARRITALKDDPRDEDLPDSFFEPPQIDSDESILFEIIQERAKVK